MSAPFLQSGELVKSFLEMSFGKLHGGVNPRPMPVVLLSAQPPHPPDDWGELPGFDAVLLKPTSVAEVLECIGGLLGLVW